MSEEDQERSEGWVEGYAEGLVDGLGARPEGLTIGVLRLCTCGVVSGGVRWPNATCEAHGGS